MVKLNWLGKEQRTFLERGYLKEGVTPEERYQTIANTIEKISGIKGIRERFEKYIEKGWVSFATPILSNFGEPDNLPISCNHGKISDSLDSILSGLHEVGMLAKYGAGTAKNFSAIRPLGEKIGTGGVSEGIIPWIDLYANMIGKVNQSSTRRGFLTAYLTAAHSEIDSFLDIATEGHAIQDITTAVTIPAGWMQDMEGGNSEKRKIWAKILKRRSEIGFPYILFEENCNKNHPQVYADKGLWIDNANICIEAIEYCDSEKEFACCLSSVNAYYFDEWKEDPNFIFDMNIMLDCVITEYIEKGSKLKGLEKAVKFAQEHRSIGVGILGFHSYLQKNMLAFGSLESYAKNHQMFSYIRQESDRASKWMAENWGEPEMMKGYGLRNSSRMAQAPTKSTSFIVGNFSSGVEPIKSNYHEKTLAKIQVEYKNRELENLLESKSQNTKEVWRSILQNNGSVQHLGCLSSHEKDVFKTFAEVSQMDVIKLAAARQVYIDMGQSINIMIHPNTPPKEVNNLVMTAYKEGVKSLYYHYSINAAQEYNQSLMECSACEA